MNTDLKHLLYHLKLFCRWSLGFVWIWEGIVPKIMAPTEMQYSLVEKSGLFWPDVEMWLIILGSAMIIAGIIICIGVFERAAVLTASISMTILIFLVVGNNPESLKDLHGGIAKDACLYAAAWVVWKLAPIVPNAKSLRSTPTPIPA